MTTKSKGFYILQVFKTSLGFTHSPVTWDQEVFPGCKAART